MHGSKKKKRTSRHDHNAFTYNLHQSVKTVNNTQLKVSQTGKSDKSREVGGFFCCDFCCGLTVSEITSFLPVVHQSTERAKPVGSQT